MERSEIQNLVGKIQLIAEDLHCASAIIAAESIVEESLKCNMEAELREASSKMDKAIEDEDFSLAQSLLSDKENLFTRINDMKDSPRIRIRYAPLVKNVESKSR